MTDCSVEAQGFGRAGNRFGASEVSYADMVARGAYRAVVRVVDTYRDWVDHRQAMKALDSLEKLDDRQLADLGITRQDLTVAGAALAAAKRNGTHATMGYQA